MVVHYLSGKQREPNLLHYKTTLIILREKNQEILIICGVLAQNETEQNLIHAKIKMKH